MKLFGLRSVVKDGDEELMERLKRGDQRAFEALYERYKGAVMSFVRVQVKDRNQAEDLVQEVFFKIYRARDTYEKGRAFKPWLWAIARNSVIDVLRPKKEILVKESEAETSVIDMAADPMPPADIQLMEQSDRKQIEDCLGELTPRAREAVLLRTLSEMPYEDISQALQVGLGALKSILLRAKEELIRCFKRGARA